MTFEKFSEELVSIEKFLLRAVKYAAISVAIIFGSLGVGAWGFMHFDPSMTLVDAFFNAAMILTGMGPTSAIMEGSESMKIFTSLYAVFSGVAFLSAASTLMAPAVHRFFHFLHWEEG